MENKYKIVPCPCGHDACRRVFINGLTSDGRFDKEDAEEIVTILEQNKKLIESVKELINILKLHKIIEKSKTYHQSKLYVKHPQIGDRVNKILSIISEIEGE